MCSVGLFCTAITTALWLLSAPCASSAAALRAVAEHSPAATSTSAAHFFWMSLMAQCLDGVQLSSFTRRQISEHHADQSRKGERQKYDLRRDDERQLQRARREERADQPQNDADHAAHGGEHDGLEQKLHHHFTRER